MKLILGDCLEKLKDLADNSVDSIVTDPPYGLSFMGKKWDYDVPSVDIWKECYRVLKHGGHLLAFGGSRTYHRLAVNVEDAGFEIRDQIMWIYGSGFPKSHNIGKSVDKKLGNERETVGVSKAGKTALGQNSGWNSHENKTKIDITKGSSQWEGWGTALKPAHEPIVMARKPLSEKTVVNNVLKWGTGGINIDDSRIQHDEPLKTTNRTKKGNTWNDKNSGFRNNLPNLASASPSGRFPANVIFDEEAGKILDEQTGIIKSGMLKKGTKRLKSSNPNTSFLQGTRTVANDSYGDKGGASRFFYCAKTSKKDRDEGMKEFEEKKWVQFSTKNNTSGEASNWSKERQTSYKNIHPTVKPTKLMAYLVNLVTPKNGIVLDPFMGSGSTGKACVQKGFDFIGIEMQEEYMDIAKARIGYEENKKSEMLF